MDIAGDSPAHAESPRHEPCDATIAVTSRCNAHCVMCNIWKTREADALAPEHLSKLPPSLKTINLSGGEPFLRNDLPEFVRQARLRCPRAQIAISTNGYLPHRIAEMMEQVLKIDPSVRLAISLDGVGGAHDRIRGDEGVFDRVMELIDLMTAKGYKGLRLGMTLTDGNLDQLVGVAELARRRGLELGVVAAHACRTQMRLEASPRREMPAWLESPFQTVIARWLRSWRVRQWLRAHFTYYTYRLLAGRAWRFRCRAADDFFFLQSDGTVYSCSVQGRAMGDLTRQDWEEIWTGPAARAARQTVRACGENCWMICTARGVYRAHPLRVLLWIAAAKPLAHLRWFRLAFPGGASCEERPRANPPH